MRRIVGRRFVWRRETGVEQERACRSGARRFPLVAVGSCFTGLGAHPEPRLLGLRAKRAVGEGARRDCVRSSAREGGSGFRER